MVGLIENNVEFNVFCSQTPRLKIKPSGITEAHSVALKRKKTNHPWFVFSSRPLNLNQVIQTELRVQG
jgi:hypothetical protein